MADVRFKLDRSAMRDLLRDPGIVADLRNRARAIAARAGPGHEYDAGTGRNRARANVWTATPEAMRAEATQRTLTRAIDAGRG